MFRIPWVTLPHDLYPITWGSDKLKCGMHGTIHKLYGRNNLLTKPRMSRKMSFFLPVHVISFEIWPLTSSIWLSFCNLQCDLSSQIGKLPRPMWQEKSLRTPDQTLFLAHAGRGWARDYCSFWSLARTGSGNGLGTRLDWKSIVPPDYVRWDV